jgi:hypothetical protein
MALLATRQKILSANILLLMSACRLWPRTEATKFATRYWAEHLTNCNGFQVAYRALPGEIQIVEFKNARVWIQEDEVSDADKLNGLEWHGSTGIASSAWRVTYSRGSKAGPWSNWEDSNIEPFPMNAVVMLKQRGTWNVNDGLRPPYDKGVDCSLLP